MVLCPSGDQELHWTAYVALGGRQLDQDEKDVICVFLFMFFWKIKFGIHIGDTVWLETYAFGEAS